MVKLKCLAKEKENNIGDLLAKIITLKTQIVVSSHIVPSQAIAPNVSEHVQFYTKVE